MKSKPDKWSRLFWFRVVLGALAGILAGWIGLTSVNPRAYEGIFIAILLYLASAYYARFTMHSVPREEVVKVFTTGIGTFTMLFLFTWILYNTLFG